MAVATNESTPVKKAVAKKAPAKKAASTTKKAASPVVTAVISTNTTATDSKKEAIKDLINDLKTKVNKTGTVAKVGTTAKAAAATMAAVPKLLLPPNKSLRDALLSLRTASKSAPSKIVEAVKEDPSIVANLTLRRNVETKESAWEVYVNDPSKAFSNAYTTSKADVHRGDISSQDMSKWLNSTETYSIGLIPDGVKFLHKYKDRMRVVLEIPPGIYLTFWGRSEGSAKQTYLLGCPYKMVIADFTATTVDKNGVTGWSLYGARMFFAMKSMQDWDQPLYATSLNNTNNTGYGNTGLSWVCFYHSNENKKTIKGIVNVIHHRVGGGEAYNEVNMPGTQGADFYRKYRPDYPHLHGPLAWEKKTEAEGIEWVWDEKQWIPIVPDTELYQKSNDINKKNPDQSQLTIGRAVFSQAPMYYSDQKNEEFYHSLLNNPYADYVPKSPASEIEPLASFDNLFI